MGGPPRTLTEAMQQAQVPARFLHHRLEHFADTPMRADDGRGKLSPAMPALESWLKDELGIGRGIALEGAPGLGKTSLACALMRSWAAAHPPRTMGMDPLQPSSTRPMLPYYFTTFASHLSRKQQLMKMEREGTGGSDEAWDLGMLIDGVEAIAINPRWNVRLLVLDDMGKEHITKSKWAQDTFDEMLRRRFDLAYPTIITTNTETADWDDFYNQSMASFARECFQTVLMSGEDRR